MKSPKSYAVAVILSGIFGVVGIHHFYLERWGMGILDFGLFLATICFFLFGYPGMGFVFATLDLGHTIWVTILLLVGKYKDGQGNIVAYPGQESF